jgi:hypothetical protein
MASIRDVLTAILDRRLSNPEDELLQTIQEGMSTPTWTAPTLLNSWVNYGSSSDAGYYKDSLGRVNLRGFIKDGTVDNTNGVIFTLPAGYRPGTDLIFSALGSNAAESAAEIARIDVRANGNVMAIPINTFVTGAYCSLSGISFLAEQ